MRKETDLLGTVELPADVNYGVHTSRALANFRISSQSVADIPSLVHSIVKVKQAAAIANRELRVLPFDIADALVAACDTILKDEAYLADFPVDLFQGGAGTSINMNANEVIANVALTALGYPRGSYDIISPNDHVNKSQSTNDAFPTALRIAIHQELSELLDQIDLLSEEFARKGTEFADVIKMSRTQLQDAVPITLGREFSGYATTLKEETRLIRHVSRLLLEVNLGATAVGTGINTPPDYSSRAIAALSALTGLPLKSAPDLVEASSDTGAYVIVHAALKRYAVKLSKICNDLRLLSSGPRAGLAEIQLPAVQAGSSIMPAKVNPVLPEVVNQVCFKVIGNDTCITFACEAGQLELNVMEPVVAQCMFESIALLRNASATLRTGCIAGIRVNRERCAAFVKDSIGLVTVFNDLIGHQQGDEIGKEAMETGRPVSELIVERGLLSQETVDSLLKAENLMNPRFSGTVYAADERGLPD